MIDRKRHRAELRSLLREFPVVAILGARQTGKSTLAQRVARGGRGPVTTFDLEDSRHLARLGDPMLALADLKGLVIIDEIQRRPDLFATLRVLADREPVQARFLVLGSATPDLIRQGSESLAGRIAFHDLRGLSLREVGVRRIHDLWLRGGFPRSILAGTGEVSLRWRKEFIRTFLERDLPALGLRVSAETMRRFWTMLAHWHGQVWNGASFARSFGVSEMTVRSYVDTLVGTYVVRRLRPWIENLGKREVKSPKLYVADSGLLHALLDIGTRDALMAHPALGASHEGFGIEAVVDSIGAQPDECFFWSTHQGAELDLLVVRGRLRVGFELKHTSSPEVTKSMRIALDDLRLDRLDVIYAGTETYPLSDKIRAVPLRRILHDLPALPPRA